jgi:hypothetical protein
MRTTPLYDAAVSIAGTEAALLRPNADQLEDPCVEWRLMLQVEGSAESTRDPSSDLKFGGRVRSGSRYSRVWKY